MKIITWNVNGLRANITKGAADWWKSQRPDVLCLQEIKAMPEQLSEEQHACFDGAQVIWNPAQRKGYSGVATALWTEATSHQIGLGDERFDAEGRVVQTRFPAFTLFNIYFPNGQRDHERLQFKLDFYAHLLEICDAMHASGEQIIITGDFNTAHREIDLKNPKQNAKTSGFLPEERAWIDKYLAHGFVDIYRHLYPEQVQYTWWTYRFNARSRNAGWRIDYFLISDGLLDRVQDVVIHDEVMGSDHCPVALEIDAAE
ncbi:MAG TPA: exodeoxyribonuclease III [Anaerolineales bacterium]|nr:exodeoxyribonuclease III [Anaerolineales bacterium]